MSSVIGAINIGTMDNGSTIIAKRTALISPKAASTTNFGSGAANTANFMRNCNVVNSTNTERPHVADQNIAEIV